MRFVAVVFIASLTLAGAAWSDTADMVERYVKAMKLNEVFDILSEEGVSSALEMAQEEDSISASPAWTSRIEAIYTTDKMDAAFRHALSNVRNLDNSADALAFFETDLGRRIVDIELDARRALGADGVEDAMRERAVAMREEDPERLDKYSEFIQVNKLVDSNVTGALNSNLAFYQGLGTNPLFGGMDERSMLAQVYSQEAEIRDDMEDWTMNFSVLAYSLLSSDELDAYIDISETKAGQALNTALFAGFDKVFEYQSFELGRAMAEFMVGDDT